MCRLHTQFSFQTTLRTPLPFHKTCFKGGCGGGGITGVIRRCGCLLLILTVPSHSPSICYLLLRAAIAVCISSTAFLSNVYCVPKRIAPAAVRIVGSISTQRIIPVLILSGLGNRAGNKTCSCQYIPRNRSSESLRHFCNKRCKRCDRRFCHVSGFYYCT